MEIIKHTIQCRCLVPVLEETEKDPPAYQFIAVSLIDDTGNFVKSTACCDNCGRVHEIVEVGQSNIVDGMDVPMAFTTIHDIRHGLPEKLQKILDENKCPKHTWEYASLVLENKLWGASIILGREVKDKKILYKSLRFLGETFYKFETNIGEVP